MTLSEVVANINSVEQITARELVSEFLFFNTFIQIVPLSLAVAIRKCLLASQNSLAT